MKIFRQFTQFGSWPFFLALGQMDVTGRRWRGREEVGEIVLRTIISVNLTTQCFSELSAKDLNGNETYAILGLKILLADMVLNCTFKL